MYLVSSRDNRANSLSSPQLEMNHLFVLHDRLDWTVLGDGFGDQTPVQNLSAIRIYAKCFHEKNLLMLQLKSKESWFCVIHVLGGINSKSACLSFSMSSGTQCTTLWLSLMLSSSTQCSILTNMVTKNRGAEGRSLGRASVGDVDIIPIDEPQQNRWLPSVLAGLGGGHCLLPVIVLKRERWFGCATLQLLSEMRAAGSARWGGGGAQCDVS